MLSAGLTRKRIETDLITIFKFKPFRRYQQA